MASLEKHLLQILASRPIGFDWYPIATRLSETDAPNKSDMMKVLQHLTEHGFLEIRESGNGWKITEAGLAALAEME